MNFKTIGVLIIVVIVVVLVVNWQRNGIGKMIETAQDSKSKGEQYAAYIKADYQMRRIDPATFAQAQRSYVEAQSAFNSWAGFVIDSLNTSFLPNPQRYALDLQNANQKGQAWINLAQQLHARAAMRTQSTNVPGLPSWIDIPAILDQLQKIDQQQRQQLTASLNRCMWARFDDIPPSQGP
jgi:hypothetical protein